MRHTTDAFAEALKASRPPAAPFRGDNEGSNLPSSEAIELIARLHRGGTFAYWWTVPGKRSMWWKVDSVLPLPPGSEDLYFCVHPCSSIPPTNTRGEPKPPEFVRSQSSYIEAVNCVFSEFDAKDFGGSKAVTLQHVDALPVAPSTVVDSGGGYHCYWLLNDTFRLASDEDRERAKRLQAAWVEFTKGDEDAKDLARVLRVPGTRNLKSCYSPNFPLVAVLRADYDHAFSLKQLESLALPAQDTSKAAQPLNGNGRPPSQAGTGKHFSHADDIARAWQNLERLAAWRCDDYAQWLEIGMCLSELGEEGFNAWDTWSSRSAKYPGPDEMRKKWETFKPGGGLTLATLTHRANEDDPRIADRRLQIADCQEPDGEPARFDDVEETRRRLAASGAVPSTLAEPPDPDPSNLKSAISNLQSHDSSNLQSEISNLQSHDSSNLKSLVFNLTDTGNAELFAALHGDELRFDHRQGRWLLWAGHWWATDVDGELRRLAIHAARERYFRAVDLEDAELRDKSAKWARLSESRQKIEAALSLAKSLPPIADSGDLWDSDPMLLGVANGVVDLKTGTLRPGDPNDRITVHTTVAFDPSAECVRWRLFLQEVFGGDADLIDFIRRSVGYALTGDTSEQCLFLCYGKGANGKTVFLKTIAAVLGDYSYNAPFSTFELEGRASISSDVAKLSGRRLVTASETNESTRLNEARIKALTGGDPITARFMYSELFTFKPVAKFWFAVNHKPHVRDDSEGFWRRVRLIPFLQQFKGDRADRELEDKLMGELPGILCWALRGCLEWQQRGLEPPAAVTTATDEYREESDPLADFLTDCCVQCPSATQPAGDFYRAYREWCGQVSLKEREILSLTAFGTRMKSKFTHRKTKTGQMYEGIGLLSDHEEEDEEI